MKICIFGERSKIAQSIIRNKPNYVSIVSIDENPDFLLFATSSEKTKELFEKYKDKFRIMDVSSYFKQEAIELEGLFTYAFKPIFNKNIKNIVFPGCSSLAILTALYPIQELVIPDSVYADVKFSKSAVQSKSENLKDIELNNIIDIKNFEHYHQNEINNVLSNLDIKIAPSIVNVDKGIYINIFFNLLNELDINSYLMNFYKNDPNVVFVGSASDVLGGNKIRIKVFQDKKRVNINVITDNLINGKIFDFLEIHEKYHMPLKIIKTSELGKFKSMRKFDIHTGIDLYCAENEEVFAMEDGIVMKNQPFTGSLANSPWWEETNYLGIKGQSGYIVYGELISSLKEGEKVIKGQIIGNVKRVLKKNKGNPQSMLHLEFYSDFVDDPVVWNIGEKKHKLLLNPENLLFFMNKLSNLN